MEHTVTSCAIRSKQSQRMATCRFCGALLDEKRDLASLALSLQRKIFLEDLAGCFSFPSLVTMDFQFTAAESVGRLNSVEKTIDEMKSLANSSYSKAGYAPPAPAHYPGSALEKESRTRAVT